MILTPKVVIDRLKFPTADDEYTPAPSRIIDARLVESAQDVKKGRTYGPFDTANEAIEFLHKEIKRGNQNVRHRRDEGCFVRPGHRSAEGYANIRSAGLR